MPNLFRGFPAPGQEFLRELKENNQREWFQARKDIYDTAVKAPMVEFVEVLNAEFARFAPEYITDPKKAMHRIYRDTRFSKNKTPYKTNSSASFHQSVTDKEAMAGFYVSVSPLQIEVAGGVYSPEPPQMLAIRNAIANDLDAWTALVENKKRKKFLGELQGDSLTRPPKGFPKDDPADFWIRKKQWLYFDLTLDPALALTPKLVGEVVRRFEAMYPVIQFLNAALAQQKPNRSDFF
jgi:uncharacterized protein (TIGR02453 family)